MKKLFEQTSQGYSWSTRHTYFLCETEEEYNELLEQYKDHVNSWQEWDNMLRRYIWRSNYKQVQLNTTITANAQTSVSDGFAVRGGRNFKATGITSQVLFTWTINRLFVIRALYQAKFNRTRRC